MNLQQEEATEFPFYLFIYFSIFLCYILFIYFFFIFLLLFICAYKAWFISPPCPHPLPYHPLSPPSPPQYPAEQSFLFKSQCFLPLQEHRYTLLVSLPVLVEICYMSSVRKLLWQAEIKKKNSKTLH
jgi:hypothetical protein